MARTRHRGPSDETPLRELPGAALKASLREGYGAKELRRDALAGVIVGVVALPLSMALSIAVGAPPQHGIYTAIVAGVATGLLGGSRTQVTGPTAAFIVILAPIYARFGLAGLLFSGLMGGAILLAMGALRLGRLIQFVPHPVTTGFTAGIATVIATYQLKDFFGLSVEGRPEHYVDRVHAFWNARGTVSPWEFALGAGTLLLLIGLPRLVKRVPAPLLALPAAALAAWWLPHWIPDFQVATIGSRFEHGIPQLPPLPLLPWAARGPAGAPFVLDFHTIRLLLPGAFAIAMLGAIESLLSAVVADGMAQTRHDPDAELLGLGAANVLCPFFGGIPATGAIARTATNIRFGGRSPVACMIHAVTILAAVLILAPWLNLLPMAALAALLLLVAWNMSEAKHFMHTLKAAPRSDVAVLLACFGLTVIFDMVLAVSVGIVLAALLFMRKMAETTQTRLVTGSEEGEGEVPAGVVIYDIAGPLFFGAAMKAMDALEAIDDSARVVVFRMEKVPVMDATGLVAFESALARLAERGRATVIAGLQPQPTKVFEKGHVWEQPGILLFRRNLREALQAAGELIHPRPAAA